MSFLWKPPRRAAVRACRLAPNQRELIRRILKGETCIARGPRRSGTTVAIVHALHIVHKLHPEWKVGSCDLHNNQARRREHVPEWVESDPDKRKQCDFWIEVDWEQWCIHVTGRGGTRVRFV